MNNLQGIKKLIEKFQVKKLWNWGKEQKKKKKQLFRKSKMKNLRKIKQRNTDKLRWEILRFSNSLEVQNGNIISKAGK